MSIWSLLQQQNRQATGQNLFGAGGFAQNRQVSFAPQAPSPRFQVATPTPQPPPPAPPAPQQVDEVAQVIAKAVAKEVRAKGGTNGTAPVGRPKGSKKPSNPMDDKRVPNVSYSVAKKIDKAKDIDYLIQKRNQYSRAINLYKKGYSKSNMFRVLIPPNPAVTVGDSPSIMTPASVAYVADGQYDGKDMNPLTANNVRRDRAQGGNRPTTGQLPMSSGTTSYIGAGGAPQGVSSTTRSAPGVLESHLARDVGAVVVEDEGLTAKDVADGAVMAKTITSDTTGMVRGGRMSRAFNAKA